MATPVLEAALADPRFERVSVVLRGHLAPLLVGGALEPTLVPLERGADERTLLAGLGADAVLLLGTSLGAAWRAFRAGIPVRVGAALAGRRWLLTHALTPPARDGRRAPHPTAELQRAVAGLLRIEVPSLHPRLDLSAADRADARRALGDLAPDAPYVLATPGAAFGAAKLWPPEHFARALDRIAERHGWSIVLSGGPGEEALVEALRRASVHPARTALGGGLGALKALVAGARLLLVGDSGPRWIAAAFDVPCVSVMGPNFPELTASSLERCAVARVEHLECAPCLRRRCPLGHHRCMEELAPERVVELAEALLQRLPLSSAHLESTPANP